MTEPVQPQRPGPSRPPHPETSRPPRAEPVSTESVDTEPVSTGTARPTRSDPVHPASPALDHHAALREQVAALLAEAAHGDLAADVGACPGWDLAALLEHLGSTYRWAAAMLRSGRAEHLRARDVVPAPGPDPLDWVRASAEEVLDALATTAPAAPVWTFGPETVAAFWPRRLLHETAVHTADVALAAGRPVRLPRAVAVDGVAEHLEVVPRNPGVARRAAAASPSTPVVVHLEATDGPERWHARWEAGGRPDGPTPGRASGDGDGDGDGTSVVHVRGTAVDLLLALWRRPADVAVQGDAAAWEAWSGAHAL